MNGIRVGIVGTGGIVRLRHMPGLTALDRVRVVGVANRRRESSEQFAREYRIERVFDTWQDLVGSDEIDAVLIATPPYLHAPVTFAALEAGKHVFSQARMAMNAREAKAMADAAAKAFEARGLVTMVCPAPTGLTGDLLMRKLLSERFCGDIHTILVRALGDGWADPHKPYHWRIDPAVSGVNTLAVGLYVEWVHRWFGATRRIGAVMNSCVPARRDPATGEMRSVVYPDVVLANGEMESGALVHYEFGGVHRGVERSTVEAYGTEGTLVYIVGEHRIVGARNGSKPGTISMPDDTVRAWTVEADWIDAIRNRRRATPSFEEGLAYTDVTEALYHSVRTGGQIDLPLSDELRSTETFPIDNRMS